MDKSQLSSDMKNLTERYQDELKKTASILEKDYLRKMQIDMFRCSIKCCENDSLNTENLESCINNCNSGMMQANSFINEEMQNMQERLQRCMMDCGDKVKDELPENASQKDIKKFMSHMEPCAKKCLTNGLDNTLPAMMKRITAHLKQYK